MLSLQQTFKKFDFFGQFITLNMNKSNCYTTGLGGLSSILIIIFLGVFFYSNIVQFVTKQKANAKTQTQFNIDPDLIILNSTNFMTAFSIDQVNFTSRPLFNITLEQKFYHRLPNGTTTKTITTFDLQPCQLEQFTTKVKDGNTTLVEQQFSMLGMSNWLCPKDDFNFNLQGAYGSLDFSFVKITVKDCVNDTRTGWNPICASEEDHQKIFKKDGSFKLQVYSINTVVNPGLPDNYLQIYLDSDLYFTFVPKQFLNTANIYYRQYQLYNDDSISPFKEINQENIILRTSEDFRDLSIIGQSSSTNYAEIFLRRSQMNAKIERNYQQIGELLSYIGGFMQITKLIFGFFIAFYNRTSLLIELSNKLYDFKEGFNKLCSSPTVSQRTPKYIQDTFRQKGFLESQHINSEDLRKRQSTVIKKNVLQKLIKKSEPIRFSVKLLLNQITCGMFFNERNSTYLRNAIDKMNEDLDLHSILFKINEISKLKEVLFNDSQIILFNFTPKPIIALKNDQMLPTRMNFEDEEQPHMTRLKHSQSRIDDNIYNKIYSAYIDLLEEIENPDLPQWQYEQDLKLIHLLGSDITKIFSEQFQLEQPRAYIINQKDSKESCKSLAKKLDTERQDGKLVQ